jgi:hypothetical protein
MKKYFSPVALCVLLLCCITVKSQNLGIDSSTINLGSLPDTINLNSTFTHNISIQNKDTIPLTGAIYLVAAVDTGGGINIVDTVGSTVVTNFGLNDTVVITYNETYDLLSGYKVAGNIIVIWPIANFGTVVDSLFKNVWIIDPVGVKENNKLYNSFSVYPNPFTNSINIKQFDRKIRIKRVRILDINGRIIYEDQFSPKIDISTLSRGIYFLKIEMKNEEELHYKLIKD